MSLRISLRQQVVDPLAKKNVKMHMKEEEEPREGAKVFHPEAARALKIKQAVMLDPIEPPRVDENKIEEMIEMTTEVLQEMQSALEAKKLWVPKSCGSWICPISETA